MNPNRRSPGYIVPSMRCFGCPIIVGRKWLPGMKTFGGGTLKIFRLGGGDRALLFALVSENAIKNFGPLVSRQRGAGGREVKAAGVYVCASTLHDL